MKRKALDDLNKWLASKNRKPLVIRGARQVGKTWAVRQLAKEVGYQLVEINFEKQTELKRLFFTNNVETIIEDIELELGISFSKKTILFLDEVQAVPEVLATLRWFYEDMPNLPVVAAGSLLDFALNDHDFSMPVGRISYFYMEPLSFLEFLVNTRNEKLAMKISSFQIGDHWSETVHNKCIQKFKEYILIGGMPEAMNSWIRSSDLAEVHKVQKDLIATFRDDFNKYNKNLDHSIIDSVFLSVPRQLGSKFKYSEASSESKTYQIKKAIELLIQARIVHRVNHSDGTGIPLGSTGNHKFFKASFLDVGLISSMLGLQKLNSLDLETYTLANRGGICEQFVEQELRQLFVPNEDSTIYYWERVGKGQGEIDYIIQHGTQVVPIEVKAGSAGSMKSLHQFNADRELDFAIRFDSNLPSQFDVNLKTTTGRPIRYNLLSLPHYMCGVLDSILASIQNPH